MESTAMKDTLKKLLDRLDEIGSEHRELFDSDVRQNMSNAIIDGFVRNRTGYEIPNDFGMFTDTGNTAVKTAIATFIEMAIRDAEKMRLTTFHARLSALQDDSVRSAEGNDYDEFLGHSQPEFFDDAGTVVRTQ